MRRSMVLLLAAAVMLGLSLTSGATAQVRTSTSGQTTRPAPTSPKPTGAEPGATPAPTAVSTPQRLEARLPPFELVGIYYVLNSYLKPGWRYVKATRTSLGNWSLPLTDAGGPPDIKFLWRFRGDSLARDTLNKAIQTQCCLSVYRWDRSLGGGFSWAGKDTVRSTVGVSASAAVNWPQDFHLEALYPWSGVPSTSNPEKVWRGPVRSYFEAELFPIFASERCSTCHAMGDGQAIVNQHNAGEAFKGFSGPFPYSAAQVKPDSPEPCTDCHIAEWKSPAFAKGINWREKKDAREICQTVNLRLPTKSQKIAHFHLDPRIKWAVSDGSVMGHDHPVAPPGNFATFLEIVDRWIEAGSPCPL